MLPWKDVYAALSKVFTLTQETQKNKADIKAVGEEVDGLSDDIQELYQKTNDLALAFQRVFYETQRLHDELQHLREDNQRLRDEAQRREADAARERENLLLRLENRLLRAERRLPPPEEVPEE